MPSRLRLLVLALLGATGLLAMTWSGETPSSSALPLTYVTTATQYGVVGYRDPVGLISADGTRVVVTEGRHLIEVPVGGGTRLELATASGQIRHITWNRDGIIFEDGASPVRWWMVRAGSAARPLFGDREQLVTTAAGQAASVRPNDLRQLAGARDGSVLIAIVNGRAGTELWRIAADFSRIEATHSAGRLAFPIVTTAGGIACVMTVDGRSRLSMPCGDSQLRSEPDIEVLGPIALSPDDTVAYFASPNANGMVDLWSLDVSTRRARRLSRFSRDAYGPSVAHDGTVLFKTQIYRTAVAQLTLADSKLRQLTAFQAETPSYSPDGRQIAVTYGTWRRVIDDAKYPDIAQEIGLVSSAPDGSPFTSPSQVVANSVSEDQAMAWSPNGKWIVFHSHREQSDDIWLRSADGTSGDRRISFLGRGAEVGWPRWSPDGRVVLFDGASRRNGRSVAFVVGVDQSSGQVTEQPREIDVSGIDGELMHAEWLPDSKTIVGVSKIAPGQHALFRVPAAGGAATIIHRFASEHDFPGVAASPDGKSLAFVAPATDGFFQIFTLPIGGGVPRQVTFDRSHKSQPAWSPDGRQLALTVWSYEAQFWNVKP